MSNVRQMMPRSTSNGRVPPHNLEAEESALGAMMLSKDALAAVFETGLTPDEFYRPANGHIFAAIADIDRRGDPVDAVTVSDDLRRDGLLDLAGGTAALVSLVSNTPATTSAGRYARIVREMALLRSLIGVAGELSELAFSTPDDIGAALDTAESMVYGVSQRTLADTGSTLDDVLDEGLAATERRARGEIVTGLPTGFVDLDEELSGMQAGDLLVLGARPSVGKSAFALDVARHVAVEEARPVLVFSLEMSRNQISDRLLASEARVKLSRVRSGHLGEEELTKLHLARARLRGAPVVVDVNRDLTISEVRAKARRFRQRHGDLGLVVIDYIQLMRSDTARVENRQLEVAQISRGAKLLAGQLDVPVLALSSISRQVEMRADKRPVLADLRESGALEADADVVMFLYRDELYHPESADRGMAEVIVAKQRNGPTGTTRLAFLSHLTRFENMAAVR